MLNKKKLNQRLITRAWSKKGFILMLSMAICLLFSCGSDKRTSPAEVNVVPNYIPEALEAPEELSPAQEEALAAFTKLQTNTDEFNRIYSTYPGIMHPCYPPDTILIISQADLLLAMKQFVEENCKGLSAEVRNELAQKSVLAQDNYIVLICLHDSLQVSYASGIPRKGIWVLPLVLGRNDVSIVW